MEPSASSSPSPWETRPLTYQHFPLAVGLGHLVGAAHLAQAHASQDENDEAGTTAVLARGLVLMPVPIAGAEGGGERERLIMFTCTSYLRLHVRSVHGELREAAQ